jgi:endonuclease YncB( thermonuclease family)
MIRKSGWFFFGLFLSFSFSHAASNSSFPGIVTKESDGDTVRFRRDDAPTAEKDWTIRMVGIDAPELHLPVPGSSPVQQAPWGAQSSEYMQRLVPVGTHVELASFGKDDYGRVLGRIEINGEDQNLKMVEAGWAIPYVICDGPLCNRNFFKNQNVEAYFQACDDARRGEKGIFDSRKPLKEMPFEFRLRMQNRKADKYVGDFDTKDLYAPDQYEKVDLCRRVFFRTIENASRLGFQMTRLQ